METTEDSEKRFERAMERLFSGSPPTPAASSAGVSSPFKRKKEGHQDGSVRPPKTTGIVAPPSGSPGCRPWDRGDLLRRLATYKSISWFGKPHVAGPVACARRGWVNVDVDLLACEACGSRLSFPIPPSWSRHQAENSAQAFAEQLDTAHKGLCAWRNNACAETLAQFPPTPLPALLGAYADRCEALLQLSALPVVSEAAISQMKLTRGPLVDRLLSEPTSSIPGLLIGNGVGSIPIEDGSLATTNKAFYEAQRVIAVCGWEPRLLPYTVDCEDRSAAQSVNGDDGKAREPGPSVVVHSRGDQQNDIAQSQVGSADAATADPASAVLDCSLCGASVGLWSFTTVDRPAPLLVSGLAALSGPGKKCSETGMARVSAGSCIDGWGLAEPEVAEEPRSEAVEAVAVGVLEEPAPQKGVLDLKLTIAGGPPPTRLTAPALVPPTFGIPGIKPSGGHMKKSDTRSWRAASNESRGPGHRDRGIGYGGSTLETTPYDRPRVADSVEGTVLDHMETEDVDEGKDAEQSSKRKRETATVETEQAEGSHYVRSAKRKREVGIRGPGASMRQPAKDLPHASSVNAIDTCYLQKQENSMESVENLPQESDGQGATTREDHGDGPDTVVQAEYSRCHQEGTEADLSKSDEGGGEEGVETNLAMISMGTATGEGVSAGMGGGGSVGMGGSHKAEFQGDADGLECTDSVAGFVSTVSGMVEEFVPGRGLMDEFVPEETGKVDIRDDRGDSQEAMLGIRQPLIKYTSSAGGSKKSHGKGSHRGPDENTDGEGTLDTTNAVIRGDLLDGNLRVNEVTDGHMNGESPVQRNEEVQSPARFPPGLPLEDVRKWETETGEFDPIRQHRHFCPWVNGHVAAAGSSSGAGALCGWQLTLDALQQQQPPAGLVESESAASKFKDNPLASVRKLLGQRSPPKRRLKNASK